MKRIPISLLAGIVGAVIGLGVSFLVDYAIAHHYPTIGFAIATAWLGSFAVLGGIILGASVPGECSVCSECHEDLVTFKQFADELTQLEEVPEYHYDCEKLREQLWQTASRAAKRIVESHLKHHPEHSSEEST